MAFLLLTIQHQSGLPLKPSPHKIQGIGAGIIPKILDLSLVDRVEQVSNEEAIEFARRLTREEGILSGISCGAAAAVAVRLAKLPDFSGFEHEIRSPHSFIAARRPRGRAWAIPTATHRGNTARSDSAWEESAESTTEH